MVASQPLKGGFVLSYEEKIQSLVSEIFGYDVINPMLFQKLKQDIGNYAYQQIYAFLIGNKEYLKSVFNKPFNNEYCRISYLIAIIKNNIGDFIKAVNNNSQHQFVPEITKLKYYHKRRKSLSDYKGVMPLE